MYTFYVPYSQLEPSATNNSFENSTKKKKKTKIKFFSFGWACVLFLLVTTVRNCENLVIFKNVVAICCNL